MRCTWQGNGKMKAWPRILMLRRSWIASMPGKRRRRGGRKIPPIDAQIAAIARVHSLVVLTADRHFERVDGITVENWLA